MSKPIVIKSLSDKTLLSANARSIKELIAYAALKGLDLSNANIPNTDLSNANLADVRLNGANLEGCNFEDTNLQNARLQQANLRNSRFYQVDIRNADLRNADLSGAEVYAIKSYGAKIQGAKLDKKASNIIRMGMMESKELNEVAPPGMEDWVKSRKSEFKKRYGDKWEGILYKTAWKQYNKKQNESDEYDDFDDELNIHIKDTDDVQHVIDSKKQEFLSIAENPQNHISKRLDAYLELAFLSGSDVRQVQNYVQLARKLLKEWNGSQISEVKNFLNLYKEFKQR